ncbi:hypothetical protein ACFWJ4_30555 [Kitasatospora sp. NPDC127067]|uniref:hypothetical protein n=1 Tax=Kitasatospora sp. NPDC127067 TaxID=3347126 RepID=UPI0036578DD3
MLRDLACIAGSGMELSVERGAELRKLANDPEAPGGVAARVRIVLWSGEGRRRKDNAELLGVSLPDRGPLEGPMFPAKGADVVGLYLAPPGGVVVSESRGANRVESEEAGRWHMTGASQRNCSGTRSKGTVAGFTEPENPGV